MITDTFGVAGTSPSPEQAISSARRRSPAPAERTMERLDPALSVFDCGPPALDLRPTLFESITQTGRLGALRIELRGPASEVDAERCGFGGSPTELGAR